MILGINSATKQSDTKCHREPEGRGNLTRGVIARNVVTKQSGFKSEIASLPTVARNDSGCGSIRSSQ